MPPTNTTELKQWVYSFEQADSARRDLLGGKGAELAQMTSLGLPVPPGFTITTEAFRDYYDSGRWLPEGLWTQVREAMQALEEQTGRRFGDPDNPLLVSVRSGAAISMPGMMDTVLNLGINRPVADGLAKNTGNRRFALDSYRRLIQMYGDVVCGISGELLDAPLHALKTREGISADRDLNEAHLDEILLRLLEVFEAEAGFPFPQDPREQLREAVAAELKRIDREIELPAGAIRVAPIEETVDGTIVFPPSQWAGQPVGGLTLTLEQGRVTGVSADTGAAAAQARTAARHGTDA